MVFPVDENVESLPHLKLPSKNDHPLMLLALNATSAVEWVELQSKVSGNLVLSVFCQFKCPYASGENSCKSSGKTPRQVQRTSCCATTSASYVCTDIPSTTFMNTSPSPLIIKVPARLLDIGTQTPRPLVRDCPFLGYSISHSFIISYLLSLDHRHSTRICTIGDS